MGRMPTPFDFGHPEWTIIIGVSIAGWWAHLSDMKIRIRRFSLRSLIVLTFALAVISSIAYRDPWTAWLALFLSVHGFGVFIRCRYSARRDQ
jgi:hypothetical protein